MHAGVWKGEAVAVTAIGSGQVGLSRRFSPLGTR